MGVLMIALLGVIGVLARYFVDISPPFSTLLINGVGSFLIGILYPYLNSSKIKEGFVSYLMVGLLGGFTTFSSYALQSLVLFKQHQYALGAAYFLGAPLISLVAVYLGILVSS